MLMWLVNMNFAGGTAPTGVTSLMALNRRRGSMYPPLISAALVLIFWLG